MNRRASNLPENDYPLVSAQRFSLSSAKSTLDNLKNSLTTSPTLSRQQGQTDRGRSRNERSRRLVAYFTAAISACRQFHLPSTGTCRR